MTSRFSIGVLCAALHAFLIATIAVLVNQRASSVNSLTIIIFQNTICLLMVSLIEPSVIRQVLTTKRYPLHLLRAIFGIGIYLLHYEVLRFVSPVTAVLLLHTAPLFIPVIEWILSRKRPSTNVFFLILVGFVGVLLILDPRFGDFQKGIGILFGLLSGLCFAATFPVTTRLRATESISQIVFLYSFHSLAISFTLALSSGEVLLTPSLFAFYVGVGFLNFLQLYLINIAISYIGSVKSGVMTNMSVIFAILINAIIGRPWPEFLALAGVVFVTASTILILKSAEKHDDPVRNMRRRSGNLQFSAPSERD